MSVSGSFDSSPGGSSQIWDLLGERVEALVDAWEAEGDVPVLADFATDEFASHRRFLLSELIKVDLEYRWQRRNLPKTIEEYAADFPELSGGDGLPVDLIYEEFHVRKMADDSVDSADYFRRFPEQAAQLKRLLGFESPHATTSMFSVDKVEPVEVGETIDEFDLLALLGKGAFASVFLARQKSMQRLVALKVSADRGTEPQTMAQLDHPHIVRVYDQRRLPERKTRLLYMQYVAGGTLQNVVAHVRQIPAAARSGKDLLAAIDSALDERGESPPAESRLRARLAAGSWPEAVCWIGARLASALDYATKRGVLHRDIKPANVLVAADGTPKLVDFNISFNSKLDGATPAAYFGGSVAYMSPEQLEACNPNHDRAPDTLDGRSDVYSLAVMLWEMLTGSRPFRDEKLSSGWSGTLEAMTERRRAGVDATAIKTLPADTPPGLEQILVKALAPDRDDRFSTAAEFALQLELCLKPHVQRLLRPKPSAWFQRLRKTPGLGIVLLVLAGVIPNLITSAVNIQANLYVTISQLGLAAEEVFRQRLIVMVNSVAYSIGIAIPLTFFWPVASGALRLARDEKLRLRNLPELRRRSLRLGWITSWTIMALWLASGFAFPTGIGLATSDPDALSPRTLGLFIASQVLFGATTATVCFFLINFVVLRVFYPLFVKPGTVDDRDAPAIEKLRGRMRYQLVISVAAPFVALMLLPFVGDPRVVVAEEPAATAAEAGGDVDATNEEIAGTADAAAGSPTAVAEETAATRADVDLRLIYSLIGGIGLCAFGLSFWLWVKNQTDLETLAQAIAPESESMPGLSDTVESFFSSTNRP